MSRPPHHLACKSFEHSLSIVVLLSCCFLNGWAARITQPELTSLVLGKPIERSIAANETHSYTLTLGAGQYAHVVVDQRGIDVVVEAYGPNGDKIIEVDSPNSNYGLESVFLVIDTGGTYRMEVRAGARRMATSRYEVKLAELRAATQQDRSRIAAQKLSTEAKALRNRRTGASMQQAVEKYRAALKIWRTLNDKLPEAFTLHEMGLILGDIGQYQHALDSYAEARAIYKAMKNLRGDTSLLSNIAWIYGQLGDNQKALELYDEEVEMYGVIGEADATQLNNLAASYANLGQYQRALKMHFRVLEMRRASNDPGQAITLSNIGNTYYRLGERAKALDYYNQALALMPQVDYDFYTAFTVNHLGVLHRDLGDHQKALSYFERALKLRQTVGDQSGEAATLSNIARLERDRGNLLEARKRIETALDKVESVRSRVAAQQLRASYFASVQQYREFYIDLLMRLHKENPSEQFDRAAFNASENGRARSLLELLKEASTEIRHGVDPSLLERERNLRKSISEKAESQMRILASRHTDEQANIAAKELATLTTDHEQTIGRIRAASPQYLAFTQPVPLVLEEIQERVLDTDTVLLEYSLGEEKSFLWAVTPESLKAYEIPKRSVLEPLAMRVYDLLIKRNQNVSNETLEQRRQRLELAETEYPKAAGSLSQILLGPVAAELKNKRLLIVSDGVLQFVPFAGLPDPTATDSRPLIVDHEIVTAPSASVVALLRQETGNRKAAAKTLAVLADPVFSNDDPRVSARRPDRDPLDDAVADAVRSGSESGLGNLRRLRFSRQEADEILRFADAEAKLQAVDFAANRKLATSAELGRYRIVHFATHSVINTQHPELSGVVLSLVDEKGRPQNGFLRLYDLYNLKLSAELVVLSACQTALGKEIRGEGLVGLTRGFMYAGAPRVVASLWQIDDRASAEFMKRFYQGLLGEKLRPAAALRAAQVSMQNDKRWHAPHYWAAFTLQGEWR